MQFLTVSLILVFSTAFAENLPSYSAMYFCPSIADNTKFCIAESAELKLEELARADDSARAIKMRLRHRICQTTGSSDVISAKCY